MEGLLGGILENWRDQVRDKPEKRGTCGFPEGGPWCDGLGVIDNA